MSKTFPRFDEYLNNRGKLIEKGVINATGDCIDVPPASKAKEDPRKVNKTKDKQPQVKEYINQQGTTIEKPIVEPIADYHGIDSKTPPKAVTKGKSWNAMGASNAGEIPPYRAPSSGSKQNKSETGFGDIGDKRLVYTPATKLGNSPYIPGGSNPATGWEKQTKTEQFVNKTKNMSFSEFANHMLNECGFNLEEEEDDLPMVTSYASGKFHPAPPEAIKYVVVLSDKNERILESLIHHMKERGMLNKVLEALMDHKETFDGLNDLLETDNDGPQRCRCLARSMDDKYNKFMKEQEDLYESVGPPMADLDDEDELSSPPEGDDEESMGQMDDELDDEDMDDELDDEDMEDERPNGMEKQPPKKKLKKKFAHHNMLDAMSNIEHMKEYMRSY